jgi:hypothetical protein
MSARLTTPLSGVVRATISSRMGTVPCFGGVEASFDDSEPDLVRSRIRVVVGSHTGQCWRITGECTCPELHHTAPKCSACNGSDLVVL